MGGPIWSGIEVCIRIEILPANTKKVSRQSDMKLVVQRKSVFINMGMY